MKGIIRRIIDSATNLIGYLKKNRRIVVSQKDGSVKVNLGCGLSVAKGWINIDGSLNAFAASWPGFFHKILYRLSGASRYYPEEKYCAILGGHRFLHHDLAYGIPLQDASADFVFTSHFLEHLFPQDAAFILKEAHRVLKPGGLIRVSVPDLKYAVSLYAAGEKRKMLDNYFFVDNMSSFLARHKYMYDFELLSELLGKAGFKNVSQKTFKSGNVPDLEQLDIYPEDSLFVEAER